MPKPDDKVFGISEKEKKHFYRMNRYFNKSRLGYDLVLGGAKHFGYYPDKIKNMPEKEAQKKMHDLISKNLNLTPKMLVLDAGCGQGVVANYLAKKIGCRIEGITVLPFEIKKANKLTKKRNVTNLVNYSLMDYSNTNFRDNFFDAIYTIEALVHSPNVERTLKEFIRVLKPGGKIVLFEYSIAEDKKFSNHEMKMLNMEIKAGAMDSLKIFRHDKFPLILKRVGFENVNTKNIKGNVMPSLRRLRNFAIIPYGLLKLFNLQSMFPNIMGAVEIYKIARKDLARYCIFTATKPKK